MRRLARGESRAERVYLGWVTGLSVLAAGFDGYVSKPIDPVPLVDAVRNVANGIGLDVR